MLRRSRAGRPAAASTDSPVLHRVPRRAREVRPPAPEPVHPSVSGYTASRNGWPRYSPSRTPGSMANVAEPTGVTHSLSASPSEIRCCTGTNWVAGSRWKARNSSPESLICPAAAGRRSCRAAQELLAVHVVTRAGDVGVRRDHRDAADVGVEVRFVGFPLPRQRGTRVQRAPDNQFLGVAAELIPGVQLRADPAHHHDGAAGEPRLVLTAVPHEPIELRFRQVDRAVHLAHQVAHRTARLLRAASVRGNRAESIGPWPSSGRSSSTPGRHG